MKKVKHLKVLGIGDPEGLGNAKFVRQLVVNLVNRIGMQPLGEPTVHDVPLDIEKLGRKPFEDEGGITAQIVGYTTLSTSHVAIHTWPLRKEFILDIFSCREFDQAQTEGFIADMCRCSKIQSVDLSFSLEWRKDGE